MRHLMKGGVWKNTEDEILKAAVMKYGKNQWARISSLLVRKSAKQCKARWYEWLDPSIKKTEWSKEEEEKLLHLAKLMPTQWRTIAPIVGRTASQCLEHYEKLLDAAQGKDATYDPADDPRRLRPGEIDPHPETKPAKPDPVDMDEDEKEMLSEARARLANTKGKKAKRKAREKQLEEARRLAALQKRRELKAAGINVSLRSKKKFKGVDYRTEIPFLKTPTPGFYDTTDEKLKEKEPAFRNVTLGKLDGMKKGDIEAQKRKKDQQNQKIREEKDMPGMIKRLNELNDLEHARKKVKMSLPEPQISEEDFEEYSKMENRGAEEGDDDDKPTSALLANYSATPTPFSTRQGTSLRTPARTTARTPARTPAREDAIMREAQNLVALSHAQSSLLGGENTPLKAPDFAGATPVASTPIRTPARLPGHNDFDREQKRLDVDKSQVKEGLFKLPKPKNKLKLELPSIEEEEEDQEELFEEDAATIENKRKAAKAAALEARLQRRTQVLKRELPRPLFVNKAILKESYIENTSLLDLASELIKKEMLNLIANDNTEYPINDKNFKPPASSDVLPLEDFTDEEKENAKDELVSEIDSVVEELGEVDYEKYKEIWEKLADSIVFIPSKKTFESIEHLDNKQQAEAIRAQIEVVKKHLQKESNRSKKLEKNISVYHGGYINRSGQIAKEIEELFDNISKTSIERNCFETLHNKETEAIKARTGKLRQEIHKQSEREIELQTTFAQLQAEHEQLNKRVEVA